MFEAVVLVCAAEVCRETLVPGAFFETLAACERASPVVPDWPGVVGAQTCREMGETLSFEEVAGGLWVHTGAVEEWSEANRGDISNIAFVIGERSVAVIDTGSARWMGEAILRAVRGVTELPVSHVVLTHMHPDHALGAGPLVEAGAVVVGHPGLERALMDRAGTYLESLANLVSPEVALLTDVPAVEVTAPVEIDLGGRALEVAPWPAAHTGTDVTVLDGATGVLIAGDLVFDAHVPALDGSLTGWLGVLEGLADEGFSGVVPGHGAALLDWPGGAAPVRRYLGVLARETREAIADGERMGEAVSHVAQNEAKFWDLFEAFNARNATVAYTELEWE